MIVSETKSGYSLAFTLNDAERIGWYFKKKVRVTAKEIRRRAEETDFDLLAAAELIRFATGSWTAPVSVDAGIEGKVLVNVQIEDCDWDEMGVFYIDADNSYREAIDEYVKREYFQL